MTQTIVFDLNERLLDMSALDSFFVTVFGDGEARFEWFQTLETIMLTSILLRERKKISELALAVLKMTAEKHVVEIFPENETNLSEAIEQLSAYPEVKEGLEMLRGNRRSDCRGLRRGVYCAPEQSLDSSRQAAEISRSKFA